MKVLKFGGTSVANANCFISLAKLLKRDASVDKIGVILSAPAKITNILHQSIAETTNTKNYKSSMHQALEILLEISTGLTAHVVEQLQLDSELVTNKFNDIVKEFELEVTCLLNLAIENGQLQPTEFAQVVSAGERFSIKTIAQLLKFYQLNTLVLDPCQYIVTDDHTLEASVDLDATKKAFANVKAELSKADNEVKVFLMPGFFGANTKHQLTLLGRNGSDYSAALLAYSLDAKACEIFTDVDGVYTCDPNLVEDAKLLRSLSYQEAMELSYFGAKVIHPKTIHPLVLGKIPCYIKNSHHPEAPGSIICDNALITHRPHTDIKGITNLNNIAMFNISGPGMKGTIGMAARIFNAIAKAGVSLIMITQSSSEYAIGFCLEQKYATQIENLLKTEFASELENNLLDPIEVHRDLAIITVIGDHMKHAKGIAAKFFTALAQTNVNIIAISQGSSERSISTVVDSNRAIESVKAVHRALFNSKQVIRAFIVGVGGVGSELISQIQRQKSFLAKKNIEISICGIANSRKCLIDLRGLTLEEDWKEQLELQGQPFALNDFIERIDESHVVNPVFVDCTSNQDIANAYVDLLNAGFNIVTPNKKANTSSMEYYHQLRQTAQHNQRRLMYETNVGAGLPVIENLQNLLAAGDEIVKFNGILSGSLSYIFGELETGKPLSEVTAQARKLGYTEPDPRDDLSGQDVARKLLILARESGLDLELDDVLVEPVLPKGFCDGESTDVFMQRLPELDADFAKKVEAATKEGRVLRYVGVIENHKCKVSIVPVSADDPLFKVKNGENALAFYTHYYNPIPLLLRGYGAGNDVTAAGIFSDILRTLSSYSVLR